ncbi:MAG TPA: LysM peptidoglycan-binding domain-containing protein [Acidimicrobiia bacterium]|nr:LysM peptidoglycan-binding domain-containing protein [Acidimicrobiia bacterium]
MVAVQVPQYEPREWLDPREPRRPRRSDGLDVGVWPEPPPPPTLPLRPPRPSLPDRATRIRRRRLAALVLVSLLALGLFSLLRWTAASVVGSDPAPRPITSAVYVVQPGDTLWSIAERVAPGADPRPVVDELRDRNGGTELEVGDRLDVANLG